MLLKKMATMAFIVVASLQISAKSHADSNVLSALAMIAIDLSDQQAPERQTQEYKGFEATFFEQLTEVNSYWRKYFAQKGWNYKTIHYKVYAHKVASKCGVVKKEAGPVYCRLDNSILVSPVFFQIEEIKQKLIVSSYDAFLEYIVAHEMGHHIENLRGAQENLISYMGDKAAQHINDITRGMELSADCLAGMYIDSKFSTPAEKKAAMLEVLAMLVGAFTIGDDYLNSEPLKNSPAMENNGNHGNSIDRVGRFTDGLIAEQDINKCEPFEQTNVF